jgi:hypothetical protein
MGKKVFGPNQIDPLTKLTNVANKTATQFMEPKSIFIPFSVLNATSTQIRKGLAISRES